MDTDIPIEYQLNNPIEIDGKEEVSHRATKCKSMGKQVSSKFTQRAEC